MAYAINGPNWVELQPGRDVVTGDVVSSYETITLWTNAQRTAKGIKAVVDDAVPVGKVPTGSSLIDDGGTPRRIWVLADAPPAPAVLTMKKDFWDRCTETEAELLDGALADAPAKLRRVFDGAQYIDHSDPLFTTLHDAVVSVVGATRADQLLAESS